MIEKFKVMPSEKQNRVLVKKSEDEAKIGKMLLPESVREKNTKGVVIAVSDFYMHETQGMVVSLLSKDDTVLYDKNSGRDVLIKGEEYVMLLEGEVFAIEFN